MIIATIERQNYTENSTAIETQNNDETKPNVFEWAKENGKLILQKIRS